MQPLLHTQLLNEPRWYVLLAGHRLPDVRLERPTLMKFKFPAPHFPPRSDSLGFKERTRLTKILRILIKMIFVEVNEMKFELTLYI